MGIFSDLSAVMQSGLRVADVARVFSTQGMRLMLDGILGKGLNGPERLRKTFEDLGATYIKLGQLIASAPGLFPADYVLEMQKCLDSVAPLSFAVIKNVLKSEFKGREMDIFQILEQVDSWLCW